MNPAAIDLAQRDTVRLVATARLAGAAVQALAADNEVSEDLAELASATSAGLRALTTGLPDLKPEELVFGRVIHALVNAAFTRTRPGGNRFNGEDRGAWYCALESETAVAEVGYHLTRALNDVGRFKNHTDYGELLADFVGPFHDLRGIDPVPQALAPDPAAGYPAGQAIARELRGIGSNGIVYPSVRRPDGTCLVAFHPSLVQNVRQGAIWRLQWNGTPQPVATRYRR